MVIQDQVSIHNDITNDKKSTGLFDLEKFGVLKAFRVCDNAINLNNSLQNL